MGSVFSPVQDASYSHCSCEVSLHAPAAPCPAACLATAGYQVPALSITCACDVSVCCWQVCKAARGAIAADRAEQKLQETAERRRAGDKLAMPNPLNLMARQDPARVAGLEAACLRSLCGLIELCQKAKAVPEHLEQIEAVVLDNLNQQQPQPSAGDLVSAPWLGVIVYWFLLIGCVDNTDCCELLQVPLSGLLNWSLCWSCRQRSCCDASHGLLDSNVELLAWLDYVMLVGDDVIAMCCRWGSPGHSTGSFWWCHRHWLL